MAKEDGFTRITLRIPDELHGKLTTATGRKRSMNAEIVSRLEQTFDERFKASGVDVLAHSKQVSEIMIVMAEHAKKAIDEMRREVERVRATLRLEVNKRK